MNSTNNLSASANGSFPGQASDKTAAPANIRSEAQVEDSAKLFSDSWSIETEMINVRVVLSHSVFSHLLCSNGKPVEFFFKRSLRKATPCNGLPYPCLYNIAFYAQFDQYSFAPQGKVSLDFYL